MERAMGRQWEAVKGQVEEQWEEQWKSGGVSGEMEEQFFGGVRAAEGCEGGGGSPSSGPGWLCGQKTNIEPQCLNPLTNKRSIMF